MEHSVSRIYPQRTPGTVPHPKPSMQVFRRRILIASDGTPQPRMRVALEDDFHHFRLSLRLVQGRIAAVRSSAPRHPYSLCPDAGDALAALVVGMVPDAASHTVTRSVEASRQCTHLLDMIGLACASAARNLSRQRYDIEVPVRVGGRTRASLWRNGELVLGWDVLEGRIEGPAPYCGVDWHRGMARWALSSLPAEEAEAALVLRRCVMISLGKTKPLDLQIHALPTGLCYAQQPERAAQALRRIGSTWDFSANPERLCQDDAAWLSFSES